MHYNGRSVRISATPNPLSRADRLHGVVAFGRRDVWAVGEGVSKTKPIFHYEPLLFHYDGIRWRRVPVPGVATGFGSLLYDVAGTAGDDVWAVGLSRGQPDDDWVGFVEHWNGVRWEIVPSTTAAYYTVSAVSRNDVWAAGTWGDGDHPTAHWDGAKWTSTTDETDEDTETYENGSSASGPSDVWVVGEEAAAPLVERFNGRGFERGAHSAKPLDRQLQEPGEQLPGRRGGNLT
jgi:hypothetical protein